MQIMQLQYTHYGSPEPVSAWNSKTPKYAEKNYGRVIDLAHTADTTGNAFELTCVKITLVAGKMKVTLRPEGANDWTLGKISFTGKVAIPREVGNHSKIEVEYEVESLHSRFHFDAAQAMVGAAACAIALFAYQAVATLPTLMDV